MGAMTHTTPDEPLPGPTITLIVRVSVDAARELSGVVERVTTGLKVRPLVSVAGRLRRPARRGRQDCLRSPPTSWSSTSRDSTEQVISLLRGSAAEFSGKR